MNTYLVWSVFIFFVVLTLATLATGIRHIVVQGKYRDSDNIVTGLVFGLFGLVAAGLCCFGLWIWIMAFTTGIAPNYGQGTVRGYLNQSEVNGVIWKTCEYTMAVDNE